MRLLLQLLILINCHTIQGIFEWKVIKKVIDYGQNVTLFCKVPNCCPDDAGWDSWTPHQRTLFIDIKTGRPNKKYDGKILKDGYTLIIQNLTKNDLNVSYSCLYGVTLGERKLLLEEDVFTYVTTSEPNIPTGASEIAAIFTGVLVLLSVAIILICLIVRRKRNIKKRDSKDSVTTPLVKKIEVLKEKYYPVCKSEVEIKVTLPAGSQSITWYRGDQKLNTSDSNKYSKYSTSQPSLKIYNMDKGDDGTYYCKVVNQQENEEEEEVNSPSIEVKVIGIEVLKTKYSPVYGSEIEIKVEIPYGSQSIIWYRGYEQLNTSNPKKYSKVSTSQPSLKIYNMDKDDNDTYSCKVVYQDENEKEEEIQSPLVEVKVIEPVFELENLEVDFGDDASIHCKLSYCPVEYEIHWETEHGSELQNSETAQNKYCLPTKDNPYLTIKNINTEDADTSFCCCIKSCFSENEYLFKSNLVKLHVSNKPVVKIKEHSVAVTIGDKVCIGCYISHSKKVKEIYWQKTDDVKNPICIDIKEDITKYQMYNIEKHCLKIKDAKESDDGFYRCCVKYSSYSGDFTITSEVTSLNVEGGKTLSDVEKIVPAREGEIPNSIKVLNRLAIEDWIRKDKIFVKTRASDYVFEYLKKNNCVTLTGSPGVGKSFLARHAALNLQNDGYEIIKVRYPEDIRNYYEQDKKTVFVVDDICGTFIVNQQQLETWENLSDWIDKIVAEKCCKIIVSCRLQVFKDEKFNSLSYFKNCECNLVSEQLCLTFEEKKKIAEAYFGADIKNIDVSSQDIESFPLLCSLCQNQNDDYVQTFFRNPSDVYEDELDKFCSLDEKGNQKVCSLALCVLFNNHLSEDWLHGKIKKEQEAILQETCSCCGLNIHTPKLVLKKALDTLEGSYIRKQSGVYSTLHDKLFDIFAHYFGRKMIECLIEHGDSDFVSERFVWQKKKDDQKKNLEFIIEIPEGKLNVYFNRLEKDWSAGKFIVVFNNKNMKLKSFRRKFLKFLKGLPKLQQEALANPKITVSQPENCASGTSPLIRACYHGYTDIVQWILLQNVDVDQYRHDGTTGLHIACQEGFICIVRELIKQSPKVDLCDNDGCSPLLKAIQNDHTEIVKLLLDLNPDVDLCNTDGCSPLCMASQKGKTDIVRMLLDRNPDVDRCENKGNSPLILASQNGYADIVKILLEKSPNIDLLNKDNWSSLNMACQKGYTEIVRILLTKDPNVNLCNKDESSPLYAASQKGYTNIVEMLLGKGANIDLCNNERFSPLYAASQNGHVDIARMLLQRDPDVDVYHNKGRNPLFTASENGHTDIVRLLLEKDTTADLRYTDACCPLYAACQNGHTAIVEMLLERYNNIDLCSYNDNSPLYTASLNGHTNIVKLLLKKGSIIDACSTRVCCPLFAASQNGHTSIVRMLLENDPNVDLSTTSSCCHLYAASQKGHTNIVKMLLGKGSNVDLCNKDGCSPLFIASQNGHMDIVRMLLENDAKVDLCDNNGCSPLYTASENGHTDIIEMLLKSNPNVNLCNNNNSSKKKGIFRRWYLPSHDLYDDQNRYGCSPLYKASRNGHTDIVRLLLTKNADVDLCDQYGCNPLFMASQEGYTDIVGMLLESNANVDVCVKTRRRSLAIVSHEEHLDERRFLKWMEEDEDNLCKNISCSPLHAASKNGHVDIVRMLLKRNSIVNVCNKCGCNPLHTASETGHNNIVKILIEKELQVDLCDNHGRSPLKQASRNGHTEIVRMLLERVNYVDECDNDGNTPLIEASNNGHHQIVQMLLEKNPGVNICNNDNCSPLNTASKKRHAKIVKMLLERDANVNLCDFAGHSPLYAASKNGYSEIVGMLLENNADVNICTKDDCSPLNTASKNGHSEIVMMLLEKNAEVDRCNNDGCSPLFMASENGHTVIVEMLLEEGSNIDLRKNDGNTALIKASRNGHTEIVKMLLANGSNVDSCNQLQCTPLCIASQNGHTDIVSLLLAKNPNVDLCNSNVGSPLLSASQAGHTDIVRMLLEKGSNVNLCTLDKFSPLIMACANNHIDIVQLLFKYEPKINIQTFDGGTALYFCALKGHKEVVQLLLEQNAENNICIHSIQHMIDTLDILPGITLRKLQYHLFDRLVKCKSSKGTHYVNAHSIEYAFDVIAGSSPLHIACFMGRIDVVRCLVDHNVNINMKKDDGTTPLFYACEVGHEDIVRFLLDSGADTKIGRLDGSFPLNIATNNQHTSIVNMITVHMQNSETLHS